MRVLKASLLVLSILFIASCSCRLRHVGANSNIPMAEADGVLTDINFAFDSYGLTAADKKVIENHANWIKSNEVESVTIEGHCDERGTTEYNMALGANRAKSVYDALVSNGISPKMLSTVSYGEELPVDPAHNEMAWSKNRRVHFTVSK